MGQGPNGHLGKALEPPPEEMQVTLGEPGAIAWAVTLGIRVMESGQRMIRMEVVTEQGLSSFLIAGTVAVPLGEQMAKDGRACAIDVVPSIPGDLPPAPRRPL